MTSRKPKDQFLDAVVPAETLPYEERTVPEKDVLEITQRLMALYPNMTMADPVLTGELGFWLRLFALRLMVVERADVDLIARYLGLTVTSVGYLHNRLRKAGTEFTRFFLQHIAQEPQYYGVGFLTRVCNSFGRRVHTVPPQPRPKDELEQDPRTAARSPNARLRVWPHPQSPEAVDAFRRLEADGPLRRALLDGAPPLSDLAVVGNAMLASARAEGHRPTAEELFAIESADANIGRAVLGYLQTTLKTLALQSIFMRDEQWLRAQRAGDLAQLQAAMATHALRLVEALSQAQQMAPIEGDLVDEVDGRTDDVFLDS